MEVSSLQKSNTITLWARPGQSLTRHIENMLEEGEKQLSKKTRFLNSILTTEHSKYAFLLFKILVIAHDFGKINPSFQEKVIINKGKKQQGKEKGKAYHSQLGALFSWIALKKLIELANDENNEIIEELRIHSLAIIFAIFNHHNHKSLPNTILNSVGKYSDVMSYEDLADLIKDINELYYNGMNENVGLEEKTVGDVIKETFLPLAKDDETLKEILDETIDEFRELDDPEEIEDLFLELEDEWDEKKEDSKLFHLILLYFSLLCDLDEWDAKSHINDSSKHDINFESREIDLGENIVDYYRKKTFEPIPLDTPDPLLRIKQMLWEDVEIISKRDLANKIISITYPTGSGKTLAFLHLAMKIRKKKKETTGFQPRIIYCLPFISITDQVGWQIKDILETWYKNRNGRKKLDILKKQSDLLIIHHHLAEAEWSYFSEEKEEEKEQELNFRHARDFINLWNGNIIVTTYVSFWNSILGGKKRNYLRFHRLTGSIIIFDEIQSIPIKYWELIASLIHQLVYLFNCTIIVGSATNPRALTHQYDWNSYLAEVEEIEKNEKEDKLNRYKIIYTPGKKKLMEFAEQIIEFIESNPDRSIMVVLNTRKSARMVFDYVKDRIDNGSLFFLSAAVTHQDRRTILGEIKKREKNNQKRILICTQVIEAGIDVTFDVVFRDLAPLDSIIQVAGRCNRYNQKKGEVYVVELVDQEHDYLAFHRMIYDQVMIEQTKKMLQQYEEIEETELQRISRQYYDLLTLKGNKKKFDLGVKELKETLIKNLTAEFKLIEEEQNEVLVICDNEKELLKIAIAADNTKKWGAIQEFREKMIAIPTKLREKIKIKLKKENRKLIPLILSRDDKIWAVKLKENDWLYQHNGGLNIPEID